MPLRTATVAGLTATVLGIGALGFTVGPSVGDWATGRHTQEVAYASGAQAKEARASIPRWLPDGATEVRYRMSTNGADRILRVHLPDGKLPAQCTLATPAAAVPGVGAGAGAAGRVKLAAAWFPAGTDARATVSCGQYRAVIDGKDLYAWQGSAGR